MKTTKLDDDLSVSGQVQPRDVPELARAGYRTIICNRPDEEEPGQPTFAEIAAIAESLGLKVAHIPVDDAHPVEMQKGEFARALAQLPAPVLAYCRTGNRCTRLHEAVSV